MIHGSSSSSTMRSIPTIVKHVDRGGGGWVGGVPPPLLLGLLPPPPLPPLGELGPPPAGFPRDEGKPPGIGLAALYSRRSIGPTVRRVLTQASASRAHRACGQQSVGSGVVLLVLLPCNRRKVEQATSKTEYSSILTTDEFTSCGTQSYDLTDAKIAPCMEKEGTGLFDASQPSQRYTAAHPHTNKNIPHLAVVPLLLEPLLEPLYGALEAALAHIIAREVAASLAQSPTVSTPNEATVCPVDKPHRRARAGGCG